MGALALATWALIMSAVHDHITVLVAVVSPAPVPPDRVQRDLVVAEDEISRARLEGNCSSPALDGLVIVATRVIALQLRRVAHHLILPRGLPFYDVYFLRDFRCQYSKPL